MESGKPKKHVTENDIYLAALNLFREQGYANTTLADIAAEAGTSPRALYRFFQNKEQLLRKFSRENLSNLKLFAKSLPADMDLKEKILSIMIRDFTTMFGPFSHTHVLHTTREEGHVVAKFEMQDVEVSESIYHNVYKTEQIRHGLLPGENTRQAASITMALYRYASDLFRFHEVGRLDSEKLRAYYASLLDVVWDGLYASLMTAPPVPDTATCPPEAGRDL